MSLSQPGEDGGDHRSTPRRNGRQIVDNARVGPTSTTTPREQLRDELSSSRGPAASPLSIVGIGQGPSTPTQRRQDLQIECPVCCTIMSRKRFSRHFNDPERGHCRASQVPARYDAALLLALAALEFGICRRHHGGVFAFNEVGKPGLLVKHGANGSACRAQCQPSVRTVDEASTMTGPGPETLNAGPSTAQAGPLTLDRLRALVAPADVHKLPPPPLHQEQLDTLPRSLPRNLFDALGRQAVTAFGEGLDPATNAPDGAKWLAFQTIVKLTSLYRERGHRKVFRVDTLANRPPGRKKGRPEGTDPVWQALHLAGTGYPGRAADRLQSDVHVLDVNNPRVQQALQTLNVPRPYADYPLPPMPTNTTACFPLPSDKEALIQGYDLLRDRAHSNGKGIDGLSHAMLFRWFKCAGDPQRVAFAPLFALLGHLARGALEAPELRAMGATLIGVALSKPNRPDGVRPLGIASALVRLAGAFLVKRLEEAVSQGFSDHDLGSFAKGGTEALFALLMDYLALHPGWIALKLDIKNAFNSIPRELIAEWIEQFPSLIPWFRTFYGGPCRIIYRNVDGKVVFEAVSAEGVIQGMAESGLLFDAVYCSLVDLVRKQFPQAILLTMHDDTYILGTPADVQAAYVALIAVLARHHMEAQPSKSAIYAPQLFALDEPVAAPGTSRSSSRLQLTLRTWAAQVAIPIVNLAADPSQRGFLVGGLPVGSPEFVVAFVTQAVRKAKDLVRTVVAKYEAWPMDIGFPTIHGLYTVLRLCVASKLTHVIRGLPPSITQALVKDLDDSQLFGLLTLLGRPDLVALPPESWDSISHLRALRRRIFLWLDSGGAGITELSRMAPFAFLGSWKLIGHRVAKTIGLTGLSAAHAALVTADLDHALALARAAHLDPKTIAKLPSSGREFLLTVPRDVPRYQQDLARDQKDFLQGAILEDLPVDSQARAIWLSTSAAEAGAGFNVLPLEKDISMDDDTFRDDMCLRLGIAPAWFASLPASFSCPLCGDQITNEAFVHPLVCSRAGTGQRHSALVAALADELHSGLSRHGFHVDRRHTGFLYHGMVPLQHLTLDQHRDISQDAADIAITNVGHRPILLDPTIVTPSVTASDKSAANPAKVGITGLRAEQRKVTELGKRFVVTDPAPIAFHPCAWEVFGRPAPHAAETIPALARQAFPPRKTAEGKDWDVDGLLARYTGRLRARIQVGRALGCQRQLAKFRRASAHLATPFSIRLRPNVDITGVFVG
jgi:hypothetical protein